MSAETTSKVTSFLLDLFRSNKGVKTVLSDFNEAISNEIAIFWKKVKPIFIQEDQELIDNIEQSPDDPMLQAGITYQVNKQLSKVEFSKEVDLLLKAISAQQPTLANQIGIQANTVIMKSKKGKVGAIFNEKS